MPSKSDSKSSTAVHKKSRKWSTDVMKRSDALDFYEDVFTKRTAGEIARSLKRSADSSHRRKGTPFLSAMSTLNSISIEQASY